MNISKRTHTMLDQKQVPHIWHVDAGGHTWPVWKNDLYLLASKLFREAQPEPPRFPPSCTQFASGNRRPGCLSLRLRVIHHCPNRRLKRSVNLQVSRL